MATKRHGYGTRVSYSTDNVTYIPIVDAQKVNWPKSMRKLVDGTWLESPNGYEEKIPNAGWKSTENLKFTAYFTDAQYNTLNNIYELGDQYYFKVELPLISGQSNKSKVVFQGMIESLDMNEQAKGSDDAVAYDVEVSRTTAAPVFTQGS